MRLWSPAARGPGGETRRHLVRDETGAIREPHRPHRVDHPDHPGGVPLHPASQTRRRFRQVREPAPAGPGGDMDRQVNRPIFTWPAGPPRPGPGPSPVRDLTHCQHPKAGTVVPKQAASRTAGRDFLRHPHPENPGPSLPLGPGGDKPAGTGEGVRYADERRQRPSTRGFRKETAARHISVPARHGDLRLRSEAVGEPSGTPATPWQFINLRRPGGGEG